MEATREKVSKQPLPVTTHPPWVMEMLEELREPWDRACWPRLFAQTAAGKLPPLEAWRRTTKEMFLVVEGFPKYIALSLAKSTYGRRRGDARVRRWFIQNLATEARHAEWYIDWVEAMGVPPDEILSAQPCDEVRALHEHLWALCQSGSLAAGVAAANWAIEGVTGIWSRAAAEPFRAYAAQGFRVDSASMMWLNAHARYDDAHPDEALEALKLYVDPQGGRRGDVASVKAAARRALELFHAAVERTYDLAVK